MTSAFCIIYSDDIKRHLKAIPKKYWKLIRDTIAEQLSYEPDVETRNSIPLTKPQVDVRWKIRFGPDNCFRVFYRVRAEEREIWVLALGAKIGERLTIGGKEILL